MNLWRQDDSLYSTGFLLLEDGAGRRLSLTGETLLTMAPRQRPAGAAGGAGGSQPAPKREQDPGKLFTVRA